MTRPYAILKVSEVEKRLAKMTPAQLAEATIILGTGAKFTSVVRLSKAGARYGGFRWHEDGKPDRPSRFHSNAVKEIQQ